MQPNELLRFAFETLFHITVPLLEDVANAPWQTRPRKGETTRRGWSASWRTAIESSSGRSCTARQIRLPSGTICSPEGRSRAGMPFANADTIDELVWTGHAEWGDAACWSWLVPICR